MFLLRLQGVKPPFIHALIIILSNPVIFFSFEKISCRLQVIKYAYKQVISTEIYEFDYAYPSVSTYLFGGEWGLHIIRFHSDMKR